MNGTMITHWYNSKLKYCCINITLFYATGKQRFNFN